jgi:predicted GIY-YIG superfamily endonuclease
MNSKVCFDANSKSVNTGSTDDLAVPVWLHATGSFYKKLNRVAKQCGLARYDALSKGLDALLRETEIRNSALNRNIKSPSQSEVFRRTMGQVSRNYWASVSPDEKRRRAQNSAWARWGRRAESQP